MRTLFGSYAAHRDVTHIQSLCLKVRGLMSERDCCAVACIDCESEDFSAYEGETGYPTRLESAEMHEGSMIWHGSHAGTSVNTLYRRMRHIRDRGRVVF